MLFLRQTTKISWIPFLRECHADSRRRLKFVLLSQSGISARLYSVMWSDKATNARHLRLITDLGTLNRSLFSCLLQIPQRSSICITQTILVKSAYKHSPMFPLFSCKNEQFCVSHIIVIPNRSHATSFSWHLNWTSHCPCDNPWLAGCQVAYSAGRYPGSW